MTVSLTIKRDSRALQKLRQRMRYLNGVTADVGFFEQDRYPSRDGDRAGMPVAAIAYSNNEGVIVSGTANIPARPFFTFATLEARQRWEKAAFDVCKASLEGNGTWKAVLTVYLNYFKETIQRHILEINVPPNAPKTEALKGFNDPLIRDGRMYDSVKFRIKRGK